jgi:hypothetical protein
VEIGDAHNPYRAIEFGQNMIVLGHGDGAKREQMPGLSAARWPEIWGRTKFRRAYTGHVHHETVKEFPGMTVESMRILPPGDYWHKWKGYDASQALDVVSHHRLYGVKARATIGICEVRDNQ